MEIQRPARVTSPGSRPVTASAEVVATPGTPMPSAQERLARTDQALRAVRAMQQAARNLALSGPNNLRPGLPAVSLNSYQQSGGLVLAAAVPKDLAHPAAGEDARLWTGADLPTLTEQTTGGSTTSTVTITQTAQQALLNWQSFNIGKNTSLVFDQKAGGADAGQWIAFNYVRDPTGNPTQILGTLKTIGLPDAQGHEQVGGQVYVMNSNGIIFGGSSQVNTHALVASSLPINYNLIQRGLLNNPDAQFLFSALPQPAGAFDPKAASPDGLAPKQTPYAADGSGADGNYGDVVVQPGAQLTAPTNADHVGGRVALVGPNVTNAGTISTEDGQAILAAGLQVGFTPHKSEDPTLRGLDVFVGKLSDASLLPNQPAAGAATNAGLNALNLGVTTAGLSNATTNPNAVNVLGLVTAPRGSVYVTGGTVNQSGVIESSTSVAYNGRVDLVAGFNAVANPKFDPSLDATNDFTLALPFLYQSNAGNLIDGLPVTNSGVVTLGSGSVVRIMPESGSTDRIAGDLALPSQVNIQGQSVYFAKNSTLLAPGAAVPLPVVQTEGDVVRVLPKDALAADGRTLGAGVSIRAGAWFNLRSGIYKFVQSDDTQQIYLSGGAVVDVAGMTEVPASVAENIVAVELRGSELANSPLQRDGPLRGETIKVDVRQHGVWDPTLNKRLGGYTWVGTQLADTSGWVGLATHSVGELAVNGGSVSLKAGGPVVLQSGATIDVSGGFIDYAGGVTQTTKMTANGHLYDIATASADRIYDGLYTGKTTTTDPKWGVTETNIDPLAQGGVFEGGYRQGGNGGSLSIAAPVLALDGALRGNTAQGPMQRSVSTYKPSSPPDPAAPAATGAPGWLIGALSQPVASQFSLTIGRQHLTSVRDASSGTLNGFDFRNYSPTPANIVFRSGSALALADNYDASGAYFFPLQRNYELDLSPDLFSPTGAGFGIVRVDNSNDNPGATTAPGGITVRSGTTLALPVAGSLSLSAGNITVQGGARIVSAGGSLSLNAYTLSPSVAENVSVIRNINGTVAEQDIPVYNPDRGNITVGAGATVSAAGLVVDDRVTPSTARVDPFVTGGGAVSLNGSQILLSAGSVVDVSGGATIGSTGKVAYGNAGSISLMSGQALGSGFGTIFGGGVDLRGDLRGYAGIGSGGGSLVLQAPSIVVKNLTKGALLATDSATHALSVAPGFFNRGGFSSFTLGGLGIATGIDGGFTDVAPALTIVAKTTVAPQVQSWEARPGGPVFLAPVGVRKPVNLGFKAAAALKDVNGIELFNDTALVLEASATLLTEPSGSVTLAGGTIDVLGQITAPGGTIILSRNGDSRFDYLPAVHLGASAVLDASGTIAYATDATGYHAADVLDGGSIFVSGNIVAEKGAMLDVSGASATVSVAPGQVDAKSSASARARLVEAVKDSNGGRITLQAEQLLFTDATLRGAPGAPVAGGDTTARGGDLVVVSNRANYDLKGDTKIPAPTDVVLALTAGAPAFHYTGLGQQVTNRSGQAYGDQFGLGLAWFGADRFAEGEFGALTVSVGRGALQVQGNVAFSASRQITVADGGVLSFSADPAALVTSKPSLSLTAPYVALGRPFLPPQSAGEQSNPFGQNVSPTNGNGVLAVRSNSLIDIGNLVLRGLGTAVLDATDGGTTAGAIRGDGTLEAAGDITLRAGQIYPPTAVDFNIVAFDHTTTAGAVVPGSVKIQSGTGAQPPLPLAAGGSLNIYASVIDQAGVLRAPLGQINLGAGSGGTDLVSGLSLPATTTLTLRPGSVTSVSALDPTTGLALTVPFGINLNGEAWVDPAGVDITNLGPAVKAISLAAGQIDLQAGTASVAAAQVDLTGGGDLYAYRFVPGTGGTNDVLGAAAGAFAILPGDAAHHVSAYADLFAPFAPYNNSPDAKLNLGSDRGYVVGNAGLNYAVGDRIHLESGGGLPAGDYTLLPARYALLPGAYLVTPRAGGLTSGPANSVGRTDGSTVVAGYRFNGLDPAGSVQSLFRSYEVAPQPVVLKRAQYTGFTANSFFTDVATNSDAVVPRLPLDAGRLSLVAQAGLRLRGTVLATAASGGRGGMVDISSPLDILITTPAAAAAAPVPVAGGAPQTQLLLDATELSSFGAASLLVGGTRTSGVDGTTVSVATNNLTVDNAGAPLYGTDVILVANRNLTVSANAVIGKADLPAVTTDPLLIQGSAQLKTVGDTLTLTRGGTPIFLPNGTPGGGKLTSTSSGFITLADGSTTPFLAPTPTAANSFTVPAGASITLDRDGVVKFASTTDTTPKPISLALGDGALLRVASDTAAQVIRSNVASSTVPSLTVGAGARIVGAGVILDSTNTTQIDATVNLSGSSSLAFGSGRISLQLDQPGALQTTGSLVLTNPMLQSLAGSASSLQLLSYSTIDFYGTGTLGSPALDRVTLDAGALRGFNTGTGTVAVKAKTIALDNLANVPAPATAGLGTGSLEFDADNIRLGANTIATQQFSGVALNATAGVRAMEDGGLAVQKADLTVLTPSVSAASSTNYAISAGGAFVLRPGAGGAAATPEASLGANLSLAGKSLDVGTLVTLPSGTLTLTAQTGDLQLTGGTLDVAGTARQFYDVTKYTDGGRISLVANAGNVTVDAASKVSVSGASGGGSAGTLAVAAPAGAATLAADTLFGRAGTDGQGGGFSLDTKSIAGTDGSASHLALLTAALATGGFTQSVAVRVRDGDVVVDGTAHAHSFALSADKGKITVTGTIDASGLLGSSVGTPLGGVLDPTDPTGGSIDLAASGGVVLAPGSWLTAAGYAYDNAGKGGAISLSAGGYAYDGGSARLDQTAKVDIQPGAQIDLDVKNRFTVEDLALNPGVAAPVDNRTDFIAGTLHVRETQAAFGNGTQFAAIGDRVRGASGIVLEGFQVFDLSGTDGTVATTGGITRIGSAGLIDTAVEKAVKTNGTAFAGGISPGLLTNPLLHFQPGAEIVNNAVATFAADGTPDSTITNKLVTLYRSGASGNSLVNFNLKPGNNVVTTILIPGGLPVGSVLRTNGRRYTYTTADGVTSAEITTTTTTDISSSSASNPVIAVNFINTGSTAPNTLLSFISGTTPVALAMGGSTTFIATNAGSISVNVGDLTLANTWDLSGYKFGPNLEPGNLTLRAKGNLVFNFDASLNDGFDPANPVFTSVTNDGRPYPLWMAQLLPPGSKSWSYRLVAGADYTAADSHRVQPLAAIGTASGTLSLGAGSPALPTSTTGNTVSRSIIIPQFYQTIRTGTGDIDISAGRDVRFLNPLATIYTAGRAVSNPKTISSPNDFDLPVLDGRETLPVTPLTPFYPAQYSLAGGNVSIQAQNDIARYDQSGTVLKPSSSKELPTNWLYRRGNVGADGRFAALLPGSSSAAPTTEVQSTSWWIDFSNFFGDVGALGGGNVSLAAGGSVSNVNAAVPTNARMAGKNSSGSPIAADVAKLVELGGGNLEVQAGASIDGGVYYVEQGDATLRAGGAITTNSTRAVSNASASVNPVMWLPTTFFLGKGRINVTAGDDVRLGAVVNPFWLPQGANNRAYEKTYFSTFNPADSVTVSSLGGAITLQGKPDANGAGLQSWYANILSTVSAPTLSNSQPWLRLNVSAGSATAAVLPFQTVTAVQPGTLRATAFTGDVNVVGSLTLAPSPTGTIDLLAAGNLNGLAVNGVSGSLPSWGSAVLTLSDADPARLPGLTKPVSFATYEPSISPTALNQVNALFAESGKSSFSLEEKLALHGSARDAAGRPVPLHYNDAQPVHLYASGGDLSGFTLFSAKSAQVIADGDITDTALYIQNVRPTDTAVVAAGRDLIAYDPASPLRRIAQQPGNLLPGTAGDTGPGRGDPTTGDIQISGPGTLQVLAGRNLKLGSGNKPTRDGTAAGITSVGATRNPYLPQSSGADILAAAGVGGIYAPAASALGLAPGLATTSLDFSGFIGKFLDPIDAGAAAARYLPQLGLLMGLNKAAPDVIWTTFDYKPGQPLTEQQAGLVLDIFQLVLRNAGRDRNDPDSPNAGTYTDGLAAIAALFPGSPLPTQEQITSGGSGAEIKRPATGPWAGNLSLPTREIKSSEGGDIFLLAPGGAITVGRPTDPQRPDQGVLTERGGRISFYAADSIDVGTSRIFTLRGGDEILWSTWGNIAAGSGSKTVFAAPPTRVLIDPQSANVQNDLAGLATGSGIGVLATLSGVEPGSVDLIAPVGTVDAGDAGIRASGKVNVAARVVLNAGNIQAPQGISGTPPPPAPPNIASFVAAASATASASSAATDVAKQNSAAPQLTEPPSIITVEVLGYGGDDEEDADKKKEDEDKKDSDAPRSAGANLP